MRLRRSLYRGRSRFHVLEGEGQGKELPMNAVAMLKSGQQTVLQAIEGFPETFVDVPGCDSTRFLSSRRNHNLSEALLERPIQG